MMKVRPIPGGTHCHTFTIAWLHLYAEADSEKVAAEIMNAHFDEQDLEIVSNGKCGTIDLKRHPTGDKIRKCLDDFGVCGNFHYGKPPDDIGFSKS